MPAASHGGHKCYSFISPTGTGSRRAFAADLGTVKYLGRGTVDGSHATGPSFFFGVRVKFQQLGGAIAPTLEITMETATTLQAIQLEQSNAITVKDGKIRRRIEPSLRVPIAVPLARK